jgi:hypothetical protein
MRLNLPVVPVTDLRVHRHDLVVSTQGRGFWILDDITPLHRVSDAVLAEPMHLFAPRDAIRWRYQSYEARPDLPEVPPIGAYVHYHLAREATDGVQLEVLDSAGTVVRHFTSGPVSPAETPAQGMRRPPGPPQEPLRLPTTAGLHRAVWDLRHPGPVGRGGRPGRGPMVRPGRYVLRLTANGVTRTQPIVVRADPRVTADGVTSDDLAAQERLALEVRDLLARARELAARVDTRRRALPAGSDGARALTAVAAALVTEPVRYSQPMLVDQIQYLLGMFTDADQRPGRDAFERAAALTRELAALEAQAAPHLEDR